MRLRWVVRATITDRLTFQSRLLLLLEGLDVSHKRIYQILLLLLVTGHL